MIVRKAIANTVRRKKIRRRGHGRQNLRKKSMMNLSTTATGHRRKMKMIRSKTISLV